MDTTSLRFVHNEKPLLLWIPVKNYLLFSKSSEENYKVCSQIIHRYLLAMKNLLCVVQYVKYSFMNKKITLLSK